jgi:putative membrane protein
MIPQAVWKQNDRKAYWLIGIFSVVVFTAVVVLGRVKLNIATGFDVHIFAKANALINSCVAVLLLIALFAVKNKKYTLHKKLMMTAMVLSVLFLVSYICHHLLSGETKFGDTDHDGLLSEAEKAMVGSTRMIYYIILGTHIPLAGIILPFVLLSAYRAMTGEFNKHKKLVRITWPVWFYVAVTGVIVYWMISPYYTAG